ncbi:MAG: hypothetical protein AAGE43_17640, partial [Pseudomonadota bacterium]
TGIVHLNDRVTGTLAHYRAHSCHVHARLPQDVTKHGTVVTYAANLRHGGPGSSRSKRLIKAFAPGKDLMTAAGTGFSGTGERVDTVDVIYAERPEIDEAGQKDLSRLRGAA